MARILKNRKGREVISRDLIFDNEISDRARFVYCFMMAKPDDWDFYIEEMAGELGYSADTLHKYINELINRGWIAKNRQKRDENNKWGAVEYTIYEDRQEVIAGPEKAVTEKTRDGKTPAQTIIDNKRDIDKEEKENKKEESFLLKKAANREFFNNLVSIGVCEDVAMEWMRLRHDKKATNSSRSFGLVKRGIEDVTEKLCITPTNVIEICLAKGWYGCQASYFDNVKLSDYGITPNQPTLFEPRRKTGKIWQ